MPRSQRDTSCRLTVAVPATAQRRPASARCDKPRRLRAATIIVPGDAVTRAMIVAAEVVAGVAVAEVAAAEVAGFTVAMDASRSGGCVVMSADSWWYQSTTHFRTHVRMAPSAGPSAQP